VLGIEGGMTREGVGVVAVVVVLVVVEEGGVASVAVVVVGVEDDVERRRPTKARGGLNERELGKVKEKTVS